MLRDGLHDMSIKFEDDSLGVASRSTRLDKIFVRCS